MGRRSKLTPAVQQRIIEAITAGNYIETAAAYVGIDKSTFYDWMLRGEQERSGIYTDFAHAVKAAEAQAEVAAVQCVRDAWGDSWQAAMTWLERKAPRRWGRRDTVDITLIRSEAERLARERGMSEDEVTMAVHEAERIAQGKA